MQYPVEIKTYYRDAYQKAKSAGTTNLSLPDFVKQERKKIEAIIQRSGEKNWVEIARELRETGGIPKYFPLSTLQKLVQFAGDSDVDMADFFRYPENSILENQELLSTAIPRTDDLISAQSDNNYSFVSEWLSNAIDASHPHKQIGRFGEGFFQSLENLSKEDTEISIDSKHAGHPAYQVKLKSSDTGILISTQEGSSRSEGTKVSLETTLDSQEQRKLIQYISEKFRTNTRAVILLNGERINNFGEYTYINGESSVSIDQVEVQINISGTGIEVIDSGIGMHPESISSKLLYPNTTTKKRQRVSNNEVKELSPAETKFFYKEKQGDQTQVLLQVSGVVIEEFSFESIGNIGEFIFEFPSFSPLEDSRNEIKVGRETTIALVSALEKIQRKSKDTAEKLALLEIIGKIYHHLKDRPSNIVDEEFTLESNMKKAFRNIKEEIEAKGISILPANDKIVNTFGMREDVFYIDPDFIDFEVTNIAGISEISDSIIKRNNYTWNQPYRFFTIDFDAGATHDYMVYQGSVFINSRVLDGLPADRADAVIESLNVSINLNNGYELESERNYYGRLPTSQEGGIEKASPKKKSTQADLTQSHIHPLERVNIIFEKYGGKIDIYGGGMHNVNAEYSNEESDISLHFSALFGIHLPKDRLRDAKPIIDLAIDFLERKNESLTKHSFMFLSEMYRQLELQTVPEAMQVALDYTKTLFHILEKEPIYITEILRRFSGNDSTESIDPAGEDLRRRMEALEQKTSSNYAIFKELLNARKIKESETSKESIFDSPEIITICRDEYHGKNAEQLITVLKQLSALPIHTQEGLFGYMSQFMVLGRIEMSGVCNILGEHASKFGSHEEIKSNFNEVCYILQVLEQDEIQKKWDEYILTSWLTDKSGRVDHIKDLTASYKGSAEENTILDVFERFNRIRRYQDYWKHQKEILDLRNITLVFHLLGKVDSNQDSDELSEILATEIQDFDEELRLTQLETFFITEKLSQEDLDLHSYESTLQKYGYTFQNGIIEPFSPVYTHDESEQYGLNSESPFSILEDAPYELDSQKLDKIAREIYHDQNSEKREMLLSMISRLDDIPHVTLLLLRDHLLSSENLLYFNTSKVIGGIYLQHLHNGSVTFQDSVQVLHMLCNVFKQEQENISQKKTALGELPGGFFEGLTGKYDEDIIAFAQFLESDGDFLMPQETKINISAPGIQTTLSQLIHTSMKHSAEISRGVTHREFGSLLLESQNTGTHYNDIISGVCIAQDEVSMYFLREGVQNSRDAIIQSAQTNTHIDIESYSRENHFTTSLSDGVGMNLHDVIIKLLTPYNSGKDGLQTTGKFGKGFFTFAVGCKEIRIKTSTGNNTVSYIKLTPVFRDGVIHDFEIEIEERNEDFKGTIIERVDELGGISGNLRALIGTNLLKKYAGNVEEVTINYNGNPLNQAGNKKLIGEREVLKKSKEQIRVIPIDKLSEYLGALRGAMMRNTLAKEIPVELSGKYLVIDEGETPSKITIEEDAPEIKSGKSLGVLRVYTSKDNIERFTKDNLWISEIKDELLSDFPDWMRSYLRKQRISLDLPSDIPLIGSRNSIENKEHYLGIIRPNFYRIVIEMVLRDHLMGNLAIPMMPEDYLTLMKYEERGNYKVNEVAYKYNTNEHYQLSDEEIIMLQDSAHMAQFLTQIEFSHNGEVVSLKAIKQQIHNNDVKVKLLGKRFTEKVVETIERKDSMNSTPEEMELTHTRVTEITGLNMTQLQNFENFILSRFAQIIKESYGGTFHISYHTNPDGGEIANSYGSGGYGLSFKVDRSDFSYLVSNLDKSGVREEIINIVAHEMTHNEEDKLGTRKWGTHETDEAHDESFMKINRKLLTALTRSLAA